MRAEQKEHFEQEDCLRDIDSYSQFVAPALAGKGTVLDLGTGGGYGAVAAAKHAEKVIATDPAEDMLRACRATCATAGLSNVEFRVMAAEKISLPKASVEAVQIRFCLHHFDRAKQALSEAARVLKPKGVLLLADAFFPPQVVQLWTITSLLRHGKWTPYFTYRQHMDMLAVAGFRVETIRPILIEQSFNDFYSSAPECQRPVLREIVAHMDTEQRRLMHFDDETEPSKYAYDGFELIARKA